MNTSPARAADPPRLTRSAQQLWRGWRLLALTAAAWQGAALGRAWLRGRHMARCARPFEVHPPRAHARVLLLGDSTGVGVGSQAGDSLAALLAAEFPRVQIVNACSNGARVADTLMQWRAQPQDGRRFDLVLVLAGGNDVIKLTSPRALVAYAQVLLRELHAHARQVVWLGCADIGTAPALKPPLNWVFGWLCRRTMKLLARTVAAAGSEFIDFCESPHSHQFATQPERYFAADGLHPSGASYRYCFNALMRRAPLVALLARQPVRAYPAHDTAPRGQVDRDPAPRSLATRGH